jgi:hypothetical protein
MLKMFHRRFVGQMRRRQQNHLLLSPTIPTLVGAHWVIDNLPSEIKELAEGMPESESLGSGAKQGVNDFR